jgi:uncharacterized membrane protein
MAYNIFLALIPVFLGWLLYSAKNKIMKIILAIAWILFVPNTIYIFTDILHFFGQIISVDIFGAVILILQYAVLFISGFLTYILSLYPIEKMLIKRKKKERKNVELLIIGINFLIGFGIVLGRVHRLNSWDIIMEVGKVATVAMEMVTSLKMISLVILFGLLANFIYFLFKKEIIKQLFLRR